MASERLKSKSLDHMATFFHTKEVVMRTSVSCRIRHDKVNSKGSASVYLQIIIDGEKTTVPMKVSWPLQFFDNESGLFLERSKKDQEANDWNLEVTRRKAKINDIFMFYRHSAKTLSVARFHEEYQSFDDRKDFLKWSSKLNDKQFDDLKISKETHSSRKYQLSVLSSFRKTLPFSQINLELLEQFETWCLKREYATNTISTFMRMIQAYCEKAHQKGIGVDIKSVKLYSPKKFIAKFVYLSPIEIKKLERYHRSAEIPEVQKNVLDQFLFSCCSGGLRFSDWSRVSWDEIFDDFLDFVPYKGRERGVVVSIPIPERAFSYIQNKKGKLFNTVSEQKTNKHLKKIAEACGIRKKLTTHVARHTFATEFLRRGGHVEVLQKLLGHTVITTTMIYVHVDRDRLRQEMRVFDN